MAKKKGTDILSAYLDGWVHCYLATTNGYVYHQKKGWVGPKEYHG